MTKKENMFHEVIGVEELAKAINEILHNDKKKLINIEGFKSGRAFIDYEQEFEVDEEGRIIRWKNLEGFYSPLLFFA